jgi:hypothetical protein
MQFQYVFPLGNKEEVEGICPWIQIGIAVEDTSVIVGGGRYKTNIIFGCYN